MASADARELGEALPASTTGRRVSISPDAILVDEKHHKHQVNHARVSMMEEDHSISEDHAYLEHLRKLAAKPNASWLFTFCTKLRAKEPGPGWEPSWWQSCCPFPYFPSYRHVARCVSLVFLVLLGWGIAYSIIGDDAAPGGQLFDIARLVISAYFAGFLFRIFDLPGLLGMLAVGVLYQNIGLINVHGSYIHVCSIFRHIALVIILTRAGLDLDPKAMKRLFVTTLKVGLVPWAAEVGFITLSLHYFLDLPLMWGLLTGSLFAAIAPAIIVSCLFRLRSKGYGVAKGIPTVVIAVSGMDDAASVAAFSIVQSLMFSENSLAYTIAMAPVTVFGGVGFGVMWGLLAKYFPEKGDPFVVPLRILLLLGGGSLAIFGSEAVGVEGAGPLAVIAAAFISSWIWLTQGWSLEDNPVATAFEIFWMVIEPLLFSLTGTQIRFQELDPDIFTLGLGCIIGAALFRMVVTILISFGESFNIREKCFFAVALLAKASVQAVLGPAPLIAVRKAGKAGSPEEHYAEVLLMVCVLSIAITAPVGAVLITLCGPRLLTKTTPGPPEKWRRCTRPSIRDITVVDEGKEADDIERRPSHCHPRKSLRPSVPNIKLTQEEEAYPDQVIEVTNKFSKI